MPPPFRAHSKLHLGQAGAVGALGLNVGHVSVEVLELLQRGPERHDLAAGVLGPGILRPHGGSAYGEEG